MKSKVLLIILLLYFLVKGLFLSFSYPIYFPPDELRHVSYIEYIYHNKARGYYEDINTHQHVSDKIWTTALMLKMSKSEFFNKDLISKGANIEKDDVKAHTVEYIKTHTMENVKIGGQYVSHASSPIITAVVHPFLYYLSMVPAWAALCKLNVDYYTAVVTLRILTLIISIIAIYIFYLNLVLLFKNKFYFVYGGLLFLIFNPGFTHISSSVSNDIPLFLITNLTFYLYFKYQTTKMLNLIAMALVIGLGFNIKLFYLPTGLIIGAFVVKRLIFAKAMSIKNKIINTTVFVALCSAISLPWYIQNKIYFNHMTGFKVDFGSNNISNGSSISNFFFHTNLSTIIYNHFWGLFDAGKFILHQVDYSIINCVTLFAAVGLLMLLLHKLYNWTKLKAIEVDQKILIVLFCNIFLIVLLLYNIYLDYKATGTLNGGLSGRYFFSAFLGYSYLMSFGLFKFFDKYNDAKLLILLFLLFYIDFGAVFSIILPYYYG